MDDFKLKEELMRRAREQEPIQFDEAQVQLFQDLLPITFQKRKDLKPLLEALRSQGILYRWRFPFALSATSEGRPALLRTPGDIPAFCDILRIPPVEIPNWKRGEPEGWRAMNPNPYDEPRPPRSRSRRRQSRRRRGSVDRAPDTEAALRAAREHLGGGESK